MFQTTDGFLQLATPYYLTQPSSPPPSSSLELRQTKLHSIHTKDSLSLQVHEMTDKNEFLNSLDIINSLNKASKERTMLLQKLIDNKINIPWNKWDNDDENVIDSQSKSSKSLDTPGLQEAFQIVSQGTWKVIYAPHMTTIAGLFGGSFDVQYTLNSNGTMESHARYHFPIVGKGFLSVSGTYSSVDANVSRVDFDKAWVKAISNNDYSNEEATSTGKDNQPYMSLDEVPNGFLKDFINALGNTFFIEQFSVFPVSYLDDDLIVFVFPLLGTRICAMKIHSTEKKNI